MSRQRRLADVRGIAQKLARRSEVTPPSGQQTCQEVSLEVVRVVLQNSPQILPCVDEVFKLIVELAEKDPHFAVLRISGKRTLQSLETATVILLDEVLAALFDELGEAALVLPAERLERRLLVGFKFLALLTFQLSLGHSLVTV